MHNCIMGFLVMLAAAPGLPLYGQDAAATGPADAWARRLPGFTSYSPPEMSVPKGAMVHLAVTTADSGDRLFWLIEGKVVCRGLSCVVDSGLWLDHTIEVDVLAVNEAGSTGLTFRILRTGQEGDGRGQRVSLLAAPRDGTLPEFYDGRDGVYMSSLQGNALWRSSKRMFIVGRARQLMPPTGVVQTRKRTIVLLEKPEDRTRAWFLPGSRVDLGVSRTGYLRIRLEEGSVRLYKAYVDGKRLQRSRQFVKIGRSLRVYIPTAGDALISRPAGGPVTVAVLGGRVVLKTPPLRKGSKWQRSVYSTGSHLLVSRSGKIRRYHTGPLPPSAIKTKEVVKVVHPPPKVQVEKPPPAPAAYQDLVRLAKLLADPEDRRPAIDHPDQQAPAARGSKEGKEEGKKEGDAEADDARAVEINADHDPQRPLLYQGLEYIDPVDRMVERIADRLNNDSFNVRMGLLSAAYTGVLSGTSSSPLSFQLESAHYFWETFSWHLGLRGSYDSALSRLFYMSGMLGGRYFFWGSHPAGLGRLEGIDYDYRGWRPWIGAQFHLGQFILQPTTANTSVISTEFIGVSADAGVLVHLSREWALDFSFGAEMDEGIGPILFSSMNMSVLAGVSYFH